MSWAMPRHMATQVQRLSTLLVLFVPFVLFVLFIAHAIVYLLLPP